MTLADIYTEKKVTFVQYDFQWCSDYVHCKPVLIMAVKHPVLYMCKSTLWAIKTANWFLSVT